MILEIVKGNVCSELVFLRCWVSPPSARWPQLLSCVRVALWLPGGPMPSLLEPSGCPLLSSSSTAPGFPHVFCAHRTVGTRIRQEFVCLVIYFLEEEERRLTKKCQTSQITSLDAEVACIFVSVTLLPLAFLFVLFYSSSLLPLIAVQAELFVMLQLPACCLARGLVWGGIQQIYTMKCNYTRLPTYQTHKMQLFSIPCILIVG